MSFHQFREESVWHITVPSVKRKAKAAPAGGLVNESLERFAGETLANASRNRTTASLRDNLFGIIDPLS